MTESEFSSVDGYLESLFIPDDPVLAATLASTAEAGMPEIQVSPIYGRTLQVLARLVGARRILEVGVLAGYSTTWLARVLPDDGELIGLEYSPVHASVARANIARAGLDDKVRIIIGSAVETLPTLEPPFDLVFIDADKGNYPTYLEEAIRLTRSGGLIIGDNVIRRGRVVQPEAEDDVAMDRFNRLLAADDRLDATILQTVGTKHHDGLAIAVRR